MKILVLRIRAKRFKFELHILNKEAVEQHILVRQAKKSGQKETRNSISNELIQIVSRT